MHVRRYLLGHGLLCGVHLYELHLWSLTAACGCIMAASIASLTRGENPACLLIQLLRQLKRIKASAVPRAPRVLFQPLSCCLACHGFSELSAQCDSETIGAEKRVSKAPPSRSSRITNQVKFLCYYPPWTLAGKASSSLNGIWESAGQRRQMRRLNAFQETQLHRWFISNTP